MFQGSQYATDYEYVCVPKMLGLYNEKRLVLEQAALIFEIELFKNLVNHNLDTCKFEQAVIYQNFVS